MFRIASSRVLIRVVFFAALWVVLTRADLQSWLIGVPSVAFATWASVRLATAHQTAEHRRPGFCVQHLPAFVAFFLLASVRGGIDVTRRILARPLAIAPGFLTYRTALRHPGARIFFLDLVSLLPGTLSADFTEPDHLVIHALDTHGENDQELMQLEHQVARLFCEPLGSGQLSR
ncbi:Na+/H+ antiporter subunit E [Rhabdochromatium marinum]|uniref:Na+/H+ antiporter subunit E n=1 Tax=Rhabdochromatium marinum TaxID=48729 RepID=UPI001908AEE0|nr:Na+/H+ antiporter subunit E [Rhabdochromatium marinum]